MEEGTLDFLVGIYFLGLFITALIYTLGVYIEKAFIFYKIAKDKEYRKKTIALVPVVNNYLLIKLSKGNTKCMALLVGIIIPNIYIKILSILIFYIYLSYCTKRISLDYGIKSNWLIYLGTIIPMFMWIQYGKINKVLLNKETLS